MPGRPPSGPTTSPPITVHQGPSWLAHWYLTPPPWVNAALKLIGIAAVVLVMLRLHQRGWSVDAETQLVMGRIGATVEFVMTGVLASMNLLSLSYLGDVGVGFVLGYVGVTVALSGFVRARVAEAIPVERVRLRVSWAALAAFAFVGPGLVKVRGEGMSLAGARIAVAVVAIGMMALSFSSGERGEGDAEKDGDERTQVAE